MPHRFSRPKATRKPNQNKATRLINKVKKENGELDKELEALGLSTEVTEEELTEASA